ncbi:MAG TPA: hypothetical protein DGU45_05010 [Planctomycetes bacterium]|nr:hypothetical protein [Planctomycetota bacterium]
MNQPFIPITIKSCMEGTSCTAVFLESPSKSFTIFIGSPEGEALNRAVLNEPLPRPMTHDLVGSLLMGFGKSIKKAIVNQIVEGAFCAILILERVGSDGLRNEVHLDCRPSDAFVLSALHQFPLFASQEVLDEVVDVKIEDFIPEENLTDLPKFPELDIDEEKE